MSASDPARDRIESASLRPMAVLKRIPAWVLFVVVLGAVVGGLLLDGVASAALLGAVGLLLGWLAFLSWPALAPPARFLRVATALLVLGAAGYRLFG